MEEFKAVLTHPIKWNVSQSTYPTQNRDKIMTLAIPVDAIDSYIKHLELLKGAKHRHSVGKVVDLVFMVTMVISIQIRIDVLTCITASS